MTPKRQGTSLRDSASFEPLRVKIRPGVSSLRWSEKKKRSHTKSYISPLCPEVTRELIFTKFGTNVHLVDIINPDKLCVNLFKGFDFTEGQSFHFSHRKLTSPLWQCCATAQPVMLQCFSLVYSYMLGLRLACCDLGLSRGLAGHSQWNIRRRRMLIDLMEKKAYEFEMSPATRTWGRMLF